MSRQRSQNLMASVTYSRTLAFMEISLIKFEPRRCDGATTAQTRLPAPAPERHRLIFPDDLGNVLRRLRTRDFSFCLLVAEYTGAAVERTSSRAGVSPAEVQRLSRRTLSPTMGSSRRT